MFFLHRNFSRIIMRSAIGILCTAMVVLPTSAHAVWGIVDSVNLAPLVPTVLDALMSVATGVYDFFVGKGDGIIYIMVWTALAISIILYLVRMYIPKNWAEFLGFSNAGLLWEGGATGTSVAMPIIKTGVRAILAITILLQVKPTFLTQWLINPFLHFGSVYTESIIRTIRIPGMTEPPTVECPKDIMQQEWLSAQSCDFLVRPIATLSHVNNQVVKRGFGFINSGLRKMMGIFGGTGGFADVITGILLVVAFVGCNLFMALLIIQAIFQFGMSLILYPFQVLTWVLDPKGAQQGWFDIWPAFAGITKSLQQLIITMIACAFILCINIAVTHALFRGNSSTFVIAAGGTASSNIPTMTSQTVGFGGHSLMWLTSILTFYIMLRIFDLTRQQLTDYIGTDMSGLYNTVKTDAKGQWTRAKQAFKWINKDK